MIKRSFDVELGWIRDTKVNSVSCAFFFQATSCRKTRSVSALFQLRIAEDVS